MQPSQIQMFFNELFLQYQVTEFVQIDTFHEFIPLNKVYH